MAAPDLATSPSAAVVPTNPFVGPRALNYGEPFFGRNGELATIRDLLIAERILLVFSPSGAGKTSLIEAGLRAQLERRSFRVAPTIRVGSTLPEGLETDIANPFVLGTVLSLEPQAGVDTGRSISGTLADAFSRFDRVAEDDPDPCFVFDQFEELFTCAPNDVDAKWDYMTELGEALRDRGRWAVFGLRQDLLGELDRYADLVPTGFSSRFRLDLLTTVSAGAAIGRTAAEVDVELDPAVVKAVVDDLSQVRIETAGADEYAPGRFVEPLLLQVVCFRRWADLALGRAEAATSGDGAASDVDAILSEYYDQEVARAAAVPGGSEADIRAWFDRDLISTDGVRKPTRRGPGGDRLSPLLPLLVDVHLIRRNEHAGAMWYELAHDRLVRPIRRSNAAWRTKHDPLERAVLWDAEGRPRRLLLTGPDLDRAKEWAKVHPRHVGELERQFLQASVRRGRIVMLAALVAGVIAIVFGLWWWGRDKEQEAERRAASAALAFEAVNVADPLSEPLTWVQAYDALEGEDADPYLERQLVSAEHHLRHDPAFVADAGDLSPDGRWLARGTTDGRVELVDVSSPDRERPSVATGLQRVSDLEFADDNRLVIAAERPGGEFAVGVWNRDLGGDVTWFDDAPDTEVVGLEVAGNVVVGLTDSGEGAGSDVLLWDLSTGAALAELELRASRALLSEGGSALVIATPTVLEGVSFADLEARRRLRDLATGDALLAIDADGSRAVIAPAGTATLIVIDLDNGSETTVESPATGQLSGATTFIAATFTDDGLVAVDEVGRVSTWRRTANGFGEPRSRSELAFGSIGASLGVDFDDSQRRVVVVDRGRRSLAIWDLSGRSPGPVLGDRKEPPRPRGTFEEGGFVHDGQRYEMWGTASATAWDRNGDYVVAGNSEGGIVVWDHRTQEETARFLFDAPVDRLVLGDDLAIEADVAAGDEVDGDGGQGSFTTARTAAGAPDAARGDDQRPARSQGGPRG